MALAGPPRNHENGAAATAIFTPVRGETVWKFGMGPERGLRKRPGWVEGVPIGRLLPPK